METSVINLKINLFFISLDIFFKYKKNLYICQVYGNGKHHSLTQGASPSVGGVEPSHSPEKPPVS